MRTKFPWILAPLPVAAIACLDSGKDDDDEEDEDEEESDGGGLPNEGEWTAGEARVVSDGCGFAGFGDEDTGDAGDDTATITHTGADSFSISGDGLALDCTVSGGGFDCGSESETEDLSGDGLDAVLTSSISYSGTATATSGTLQLSLDYSCEGADCATVEGFLEVSLPCSSVVEFDITYAG